MTKIRSDDRIHLGQNLKQIREQRGLLQIDIVRELQLRGFSIQKQNYSRIEKEQEHVSASMLLELCDILDVDLKDFFTNK